MMKSASGVPSDSSWPANQVESCAVAALIPHTRNARTHADEQVAQIMASIREFGFTVPILRDEAGTVLAGHARLTAAQRLGIKHVPVLTARGWSDAKKRAYVLADNRLAQNSEWDPGLLKVELADLHAANFDLELLGFDEDLERFLAEDTSTEDAPAGDRYSHPQINPAVDPATLRFQPSLAPTMETKEYSDAELSLEDCRLQKRFERPPQDPFRAVCPSCGREFFIDV